MLLLTSCLVHPHPGPNDSNFSLAHLTVMSLGVIDKLSEISAFTSLHGFDVFAFSETWRNSDVTSDSILIPGYGHPLRKDCGGGVAIYVKDHIAIKGRYDFELSDSLVLLWAQCNINDFVILCGVCCRPPNQSAEDKTVLFELLQQCFDKIKLCGDFGDFNAHYNFGDTPSPNTDIGIKLFNFLECNNLYQLVDKPT